MASEACMGQGAASRGSRKFSDSPESLNNSDVRLESPKSQSQQPSDALNSKHQAQSRKARPQSSLERAEGRAQSEVREKSQGVRSLAGSSDGDVDSTQGAGCQERAKRGQGEGWGERRGADNGNRRTTGRFHTAGPGKSDVAGQEAFSSDEKATEKAPKWPLSKNGGRLEQARGRDGGRPSPRVGPEGPAGHVCSSLSPRDRPGSNVHCSLFPSSEEANFPGSAFF